MNVEELIDWCVDHLDRPRIKTLCKLLWMSLSYVVQETGESGQKAKDEILAELQAVANLRKTD